MDQQKKGFIPVMITPFKGNKQIDFEALTRLTNLYMDAGAVGLFANCLSSEMYELNQLERLQITKHVVEAAEGRVPVVATGTFSGSLQEKADFVKRIYDTGVEAVIAITGLLADEGESDAVFDENVYRLLDLTDPIPLGFYECPVPYKRILSARQLEQFIKTGRIIYHKDTCLDLAQVKEKLSVSRNYPFGLYDAYAGHAVESLKAGSAGLSCIQGNYWPGLVCWLCENYNNQHLGAEIERVQEFLVRNMEIVHQAYPATAKYYLQKKGLSLTTLTRQEGGEFTYEIKKGIDHLFNDYTILQNELQLQIE